MSVAGSDTLPQLFVVDSQAPYVHLPSGRRSRKPSTIQILLLLLVVLALLGVFVEGVFIYYLYSKTQVGTTMSQIGDKENTDNLPTAMGDQPKTQQKPSAHLSGSTNLTEGIIQWNNINSTATFTYQMDYKNGHLMVPKKGFYFLYSKVYLDLSEGCTSFQLMKFMKRTAAYNKPIELIRSKRFSCPDNGRSTVMETFLCGIFHLMPKDKVYVTLENKAMKQQNIESFMGAFMLY
ncbi:unnamed protein product [Lota lota]